MIVNKAEQLFGFVAYNETDWLTSYIGLFHKDIPFEIIKEDVKTILDLLGKKFQKWSLRYPFEWEEYVFAKDYTCIEVSRLLRDIYPSYYWMKKKNMIANLDSFAEMQNWGQREKFAIKQLIVENYIPLNNDIETPHTSTPTTTDQNNQYIDFIKYYQSINMLDNKLYDNLYTQFLPLMKTIYV